MKKTMHILAAMAALTLISSPALASDAPDAAKLFKKKCKMCHALDKKKVGPAVNAMHKDAAFLKDTITNGRKMMPKFGKKFSADEIDALVAFIQENQAEAE